MRLKDADKITITRQDYAGALTLKERLRRLLNFQPTVEAIPVEWLKKYFNHRMRNGKIWYYDVKEDKLYQAWGVDDIIDECYRDWEEENGIS